MCLSYCRWDYVKMQFGDDSLWESFPRALWTQEGAERYISAFQAPFQELPTLSPQQIYTLWACSLLVIPSPVGRMVPQRGFPTDLTELNLSGWAALVQDVVAGLQVLPPRLSHDLGHQVVALLQLLEVATGVGFCCHCCNPRPHCKCMGASHPAPPMLWSQIVEQTPGYGLTSSSRGVTHPSTSMGGMPGYVAPPPGLTPPDYSIWSMPPLEASLPEGLPGSPWYQPSHWEGHTIESHSGQAGSGAVGSSIAGSSIAGSSIAGSSDGAHFVPSTPIFQGSAGHPIPAGGSAAEEVYGDGSHLRLHR